ncbi:hypothetical protein SPHINGOR109_60064 [Sphingorhabdus sp. 109]|nr:hypothetical protein SPHINGOR109_60064 [Sphingorhabdus sp. 109]
MISAPSRSMGHAILRVCSSNSSFVRGVAWRELEPATPFFATRLVEAGVDNWYAAGLIEGNDGEVTIFQWDRQGIWAKSDFSIAWRSKSPI